MQQGCVQIILKSLRLQVLNEILKSQKKLVVPGALWVCGINLSEILPIRKKPIKI